MKTWYVFLVCYLRTCEFAITKQSDFDAAVEHLDAFYGNGFIPTVMLVTTSDVPTKYTGFISRKDLVMSEISKAMEYMSRAP